ncbi:MAG: beta-propeller fold lactonase family protein [Muribaculaceae bacterium]|nr:beta-propeller fold lactonase family protein [Muribaculaceae bacterium]
MKLRLLQFLACVLLVSMPSFSSVESIPSAVHPSPGISTSFGNGREIRLERKIQNFSGQRDADIVSPKSVNIHPSGRKFYINCLEGGKTVVYSLPGFEKLAVVNHRFTDADSALWAPASGLFKFRHYTDRLNTFMGKPVESTFSHGGRYLWVPYYRRSYDLNAQDPSAMAIIDTRTDTIVRMMETGVLPKMVATSPDGKTLAVSHWGDNTVGLIDISSSNPKDWHYLANVVVGHQLFHNFSLTVPVNRDRNTGEALRGTVFTPDSRHLLVGCLGGGGIAVIDVKEKKYLGKLTGTLPNLRHLVIKDKWLYISINQSGHVQRVPMSEILSKVNEMDGKGNVALKGLQTLKVAPGARTLEVTPKGDYIFVACNIGSRVCVVDSSMNLVGEIPADSYPVGLDISRDGKWLITTSQGRKDHGGGNCVDIFSLTGIEGGPEYKEEISADTISFESIPVAEDVMTGESATGKGLLYSPVKIILICLPFALLVIITLIVINRRNRK